MYTILKPQIQNIGILCCTYKRKHLLENVFKNLILLELPQNIPVTFILVDNDKNQSAKPIFEKHKDNLRIEAYYFCEPIQGLCFARNKSLDIAEKMNFSHIAIFDDDGLPDHNWLLKHIEFYNNCDALISYGPQFYNFVSNTPSWIKNNRIFKQSTTKLHGKHLSTCATNNVFLPSIIFKDKILRFNEKYNFMGTEDGHFFMKAVDSGFTIGFNLQAIVFEQVVKERANLKYILKKSFHCGYCSAMIKLESANKLTRLGFAIEQILLFILCLACIPACLLLGLTTFVNIIGKTLKTLGKLIGCIILKPYRFYS